MLGLARLAQSHRGGTPPPTDPYFSSVASLLHFDGTNGSTVFTDNAAKTSWTSVGGAALSTSQSKFGGASLLLNGSTSYVSADTPSVIDLSTGDFTIEAEVYLLSVTSVEVLLAIWDSSTNLITRTLFNSDASMQFSTSADVLSTTSSVVTANVWTAVAFVRSGSSVYIFVNGVIAATGTTTPVSAIPASVEIGRNQQSDVWYLDGYIDEFRITKGVARYTANYTPATSPFPNS